MPQMSDVRSVAANTTVANVLQGKTNEFLTGDSVVRVGATASAAGIFMSLLIGDVVVVQDQEIGVNIVAGGLPQDPEEIIVDDVGEAGDRMVLSLRNSTAGAITTQVVVKTTPA